MSPEVDAPKEPREPLLPGHCLLLPNPAFLFGAAGKMTQGQMGVCNARYKNLDEKLFKKNVDGIFAEYGSVIDLLSQHIGKRNIVVVRNTVECF